MTFFAWLAEWLINLNLNDQKNINRYARSPNFFTRQPFGITILRVTLDRNETDTRGHIIQEFLFNPVAYHERAEAEIRLLYMLSTNKKEEGEEHKEAH